MKNTVVELDERTKDRPAGGQGATTMEVTVFLLPVPLQVIRSRDSFTPRTTGIQLLSAVVLEEAISTCRKQFDIQQTDPTHDRGLTGS